MGIFRVGIVRVGVILGGKFPVGNCPGVSYPRWEFSSVGVFRMGIVRWESSGWQFPWYHYEVPDDNVQRQFVYFIVASCRNDLKSFFRLKKSEILHSYFCQRYTPNTTKSDTVAKSLNLVFSSIENNNLKD